MKYILLLLLLTNSLLSEERSNKQISIYGYISHHVANSKTYNDGKDFYIIESKELGKKSFLFEKMQLIFNPNKIKIKIKENYFHQKYKLTGHIVDSDYKKNLNFYTYKAFQIDTIQEITSKIKAISEGSITRVKFLFLHKMTTIEQARRKKIEPTYIKNIKVKAGNKVIFNMKTNYYLAKNPFVKFKYYNEDANASILKLEYTDNKNFVITDEKKIRKRKAIKEIIVPFVPSRDANKYRVKNKTIKDMFGDVTLIEDGIKLKYPKHVQNSASIPIGIKSNIDAKSVTLFSLGDSGDLEFTAKWMSTPHSIIDYLTKIKMRESFDIQVVIEAKDGKFYTIKQNIEIWRGGDNCS